MATRWTLETLAIAGLAIVALGCGGSPTTQSRPAELPPAPVDAAIATPVDAASSPADATAVAETVDEPPATGTAEPAPQGTRNFRVVPGPPKVVGSLGTLDKEAIRRAIRQRLAALKTCFDDERKRNKGQVASGASVELELVVDPKGKVAKATVKGGSPKLQACITKVLDKVVFLAQPNGGTTTITYPMTFEPEA